MKGKLIALCLLAGLVHPAEPSAGGARPPASTGVPLRACSYPKENTHRKIDASLTGARHSWSTTDIQLRDNNGVASRNSLGLSQEIGSAAKLGGGSASLQAGNTSVLDRSCSRYSRAGSSTVRRQPSSDFSCRVGSTLQSTRWHGSNHSINASMQTVTGEVRPSIWKDDVGKRYRELRPPKKRQPSCVSILSEANMRTAMEKSLSAQKLAAETKLDEIVMMLDLDKCAIFGNDGNDVGIALQWMEKPQEEIIELYRLLVNPCLRAAYEELKSKAKKVRVVIYTMRATFLLYRSCFRRAVIMLNWDPSWHHDGQVYFPPEVTTAEEVLQTTSCTLLEEEEIDLKKSIERLFAARQVVSEVLGLEGLPDLVVTAQPKDVESTARHLGYDPDHAFLWDDNPKLASNRKVISVKPYDHMTAACKSKLMDFLNARLRPEEMDEDLLEFMLDVDPKDRALQIDPISGLPEYYVPMTTADHFKPWGMPQMASLVRQEPVLKALMPAMESGSWSPVTPESESAPSPLKKDRSKKSQALLGMSAEKTGTLSPITPEAEAVPAPFKKEQSKGSQELLGAPAEESGTLSPITESESAPLKKGSSTESSGRPQQQAKGQKVLPLRDTSAPDLMMLKIS